jgi:hypothetical protein
LRASRRMKVELPESGLYGSRRRYAPPHHEPPAPKPALHTDHEHGIVAAGFRLEQCGRMILWCTWLPGHEVGSDRWRLHILASIALPVGEVCNFKARLGSWRGFAPEWTAEGHEGLNE